MKKTLITAALVASISAFAVACGGNDATPSPTTPAEAVESMAAEVESAAASMQAEAEGAAESMAAEAAGAAESMAADAAGAVESMVAEASPAA